MFYTGHLMNQRVFSTNVLADQTIDSSSYLHNYLAFVQTQKSATTPQQTLLKEEARDSLESSTKFDLMVEERQNQIIENSLKVSLHPLFSP